MIRSAAPLDPGERWKLAQKLAIPAKCDVDPVDLPWASTVLRRQVVASGTGLFQFDSLIVEEFEDRVFSGYARFNEERRELPNQVRGQGLSMTNAVLINKVESRSGDFKKIC